MDIKSALSKSLGLKELTGSSLKKAIRQDYDRLADGDKKRVSRQIAHEVVKCVKAEKGEKKREKSGDMSSLAGTNVLAVNHVGPLDITIEWKTGTDGTLELAGCHVHSGGDQVNVSKVFGDFGENIALVAVTGKEGGEITDEWERNFLNEKIIPSFIRATGEDQQVVIYNMVDDEPLPGMFEWADELTEKALEDINRETMAMLEAMFEGRSGNVWMVLSAGGPVRYNKELACYASLVKKVKAKYKDKVEFLIDFKHVSGPEEALSVLDIPRETPQDIIKPNLEEFIQILAASGLAGADAPDKDSITEEAVKTYAGKLRKKYNLLGVLVSMDKAGVMLVMRDKVIKEKGIRIELACHTAAGDSLKAGFVYALSKGRSFEEAVHTGNLFGASTASMEGTRTVTPERLAIIEALARSQNAAPETECLEEE